MPEEKPSKVYMAILIGMFIFFVGDLSSPAAGALGVLLIMVVFSGISHIILAAFIYYSLFWLALKYASRLPFGGEYSETYGAMLVAILTFGHFFWRCLGCVPDEAADPYMRRNPPGH